MKRQTLSGLAVRVFQSVLRIIFVTIITFQFAIPMPALYAQTSPQDILDLPAPGRLLTTSEPFEPALIKGLTIHADNPLLFDFIVDPGDSGLSGDALYRETIKMVGYFLASLTVPEDQIWVNLSPYEQERMISQGLGQTEMGRDLLAQDYMLKQITASLGYPESKLGTQFWQQVYRLAQEKFGTTNIPIKTFNKVWIVPRKAAVYEHDSSVFVVSRDLKVMLEEDYLALQKSLVDPYHKQVISKEETKKVNDVSSQVVKEIILPELEKEVNAGKNFANLRQIYNAMILAKWYKDNLRQTLLSRVYADQNKTKGIDLDDPQVKERIYQQYLNAFKQGVYNFIKEDYDPQAKTVIPRKYFSGGVQGVRDVERVVVSSGLTGQQRAELPDQERALNFQVSLVDVGPQAVSSAIEDVDRRHTRPARNIPVQFADEDVNKIFSKLKETGVSVIVNMTEESIIPQLSRPGNDQYAQKAIGAGGLGFLDGETTGALNATFEKELPDMKLFGMTLFPLYERYVRNGVVQSLNWDDQKDIAPIMIIGRDGKPRPMSFKVNFRGITTEPEGVNYVVYPYWVNNNGTLQIGLRAPNTVLLDHLYPQGDARWIEYGFFARAAIEFMKAINLSPDVIRLNESHLALVRSAMQNDIDHINGNPKLFNGEKSTFDKTNIELTSHTAELVAVPFMDDLGKMKWLVGWDLMREDMLSTRPDGSKYYNGLEALSRHAKVTNTVSKEHKTVTQQLLLPGASGETMTYIQNGSDPQVWRMETLNKLIEDVGLAGVTGEDLFKLGQAEKTSINDFLRKQYGENSPVFTDQNRMLFGLLRRGVEYKEAGLLIPLIEWITGDQNVDYFYKKEHLGKGLGANILIGGQGQDDVGRGWITEFKKMQADTRFKGKLVYVEDTGVPIMRKVVSAVDVWINVPDPTREASGTSQQRAGFNGKPVIATIRAGFEAQIMHGVNGWIVDAFPELSLGELIARFDPMKGDVISQSREEFREKGRILVAQYLSEAAEEYAAYLEGSSKSWEEKLLKSFRMAHDTVSIERMAKEYGLLMASIVDGTGVSGFEQRRMNMFLADLLRRISKWHPELQDGRALSTEQIAGFIQEVWTPLDTLVLGEKSLEEFVTDGNALQQYLRDYKAVQNESGAWNLSKVGEGVLSSSLTGQQNIGGINLNASLLDLQVKRDGSGIPFPLPQQPVQQLQVEGFVPLIINVTPVTNLPLLLGDALKGGEGGASSGDQLSSLGAARGGTQPGVFWLE